MSKNVRDGYILTIQGVEFVQELIEEPVRYKRRSPRGLSIEISASRPSCWCTAATLWYCGIVMMCCITYNLFTIFFLLYILLCSWPAVILSYYYSDVLLFCCSILCFYRLTLFVQNTITLIAPIDPVELYCEVVGQYTYRAGIIGWCHGGNWDV